MDKFKASTPVATLINSVFNSLCFYQTRCPYAIHICPHVPNKYAVAGTMQCIE